MSGELLARMGVAPTLQCFDCPVPGPFEPLSSFGRPVAFCPIAHTWRCEADWCVLPREPRGRVETGDPE